MDLVKCKAANKMAKDLFKYQQKLIPEIDDSFTDKEKIEILVASVRMLMVTTYKLISCGDELFLAHLIVSTEESLHDALNNMISKDTPLN